MTSLQSRIGTWHRTRFPDAQIEHVTMKLSEETGEVAKAVNGVLDFNSAHPFSITDVVDELADVVIVSMVLVDRYADADLLQAVENKLAILIDPNSGHRAALQEA